jgi:hypothetical protein
MAPIKLTMDGIKNGYEAYIDKFNTENKDVDFNRTFTKVTLDANAIKTFDVSNDKFNNYYHDKLNPDDAAGATKLWFSRATLMFSVLEEFIEKNGTSKKIVDLDNYELGIFGSMTPSSDIDIGVSYTGKDVINIAGVIKAIEDVYVTVLGCSTLNLDIEHYASMLQVGDNYLLDMDDFKPDIPTYRKFLTLASASIHRNHMKPENTGNNTTPLTYDTAIGYLIQENRLPELIDLLPKNQDWFSAGATAAKRQDGQIVVGEDDYNKMRSAYYARVITAQESFQKLRDAVNDGKKYADTKDLRYQTIIDMGNADLYREESYLLTPTVLHVVRTIQSEEKEESTQRSERKPIVFPNCDIKPSPSARCAIGGYGFLLSALEQIGYLIRFNGTVNKIAKYEPRLMDALRRCVEPFKFNVITDVNVGRMVGTTKTITKTIANNNCADVTKPATPLVDMNTLELTDMEGLPLTFP